MNARDALISNELPRRCKVCNSSWYDYEKHKQSCPVPQLIARWDKLQRVCYAARDLRSVCMANEQAQALDVALSELDKTKGK